MKRMIFCGFNMDTACVELKFTDGSTITIDCKAVETALDADTWQRSELDWLIYNKPLEYAQLMLGGDLGGTQTLLPQNAPAELHAR